MPSTDLAVDRPESRTAKARAVRLTQTAHRAVDDPVQLARAARIVRAALARRRLTLADLAPLPAVEQQARVVALLAPSTREVDEVDAG